MDTEITAVSRAFTSAEQRQDWMPYISTANACEVSLCAIEFRVLNAAAGASICAHAAPLPLTAPVQGNSWPAGQYAAASPDRNDA